MKTVEGKYTAATIMTDDVEQYAIAQVKALCDNPVFESEKIVCMPDIHPGKVTPIGFTATITDWQNKGVMPNLIGTDIGCGILAIKLKDKRFEPQKLDKVIRENIPSGYNHRKDASLFDKILDDLLTLRCEKYISDNYKSSLGTLGGGNHFIEIDKDPDDGHLWLVIHSGSRTLGSSINKYYLDKAHENNPEIPYELGVLRGDLVDDYFNDCADASYFAYWNRKLIADIIIKNMKFTPFDTDEYDDYIDAEHNAIDVYGDKNEILLVHKGAINAFKREVTIIPINSKDGIIIGLGKANPDWNYSAPHGAGRILNRTDVKNQHTVS